MGASKVADRFWSMPAFSRFVLGFVTMLVLALSWPLTLWFVLRHCPGHFQGVLNNEQTFTTAHHLLFTSAVGLFLATVRRGVLAASDRLSLIILLCLFILIQALAWQDTFSGTLGAHQVSGACQLLAAEDNLRGRAAKPDATFAVDLASYQAKVARDGLRGTLARLNANGYASALLTWLILNFVGLYVWYCWTASQLAQETARANGHGLREQAQLVVVALLLILWIPLRTYTDWYQNAWKGPVWVSPAAVFGLIVALLMAVYLTATALRAYWQKQWAKVTTAVGGAIVAFVSFMLSVLPQWAAIANQFLSPLTPLMNLAIWFLGGVLSLGLARRFL